MLVACLHGERLVGRKVHRLHFTCLKFVLIPFGALLLSGCALLASKEAVVGCQTADTVTTLHGLSLGAKEANPIVAWILEKSGTPGFVAVKAGVTLLVLYHYPVISADLLAVANGVTCAAAAHNMRVANKLQSE